jgi:hypothetical protein
MKAKAHHRVAEARKHARIAGDAIAKAIKELSPETVREQRIIEILQEAAECIMAVRSSR